MLTNLTMINFKLIKYWHEIQIIATFVCCHSDQTLRLFKAKYLHF